MGVTHQKVMGTTILGLAVLLLSWSCAVGAEQAQAEQKSSEQLLMEIVDLHSRLVTNDVFLAQAKMLGAYLESAQPLEESKKAAIYRSVLGMLEKIKESSAQVSATPPQEKAKPEQKSPGIQPPEGPTKYTRGMALLEVFKGESFSQLPDLPIMRTYWKQSLAQESRGGPGSVGVSGGASDRVAKFTFWYEAAQPGTYGFILTSRSAECLLRIGGVDVAKQSQYRSGEEQGMCILEKGFHRVEFWVKGRGFEVKIHPPGAFNPVLLTADMMLLPADQVKVPQAGQQKGASGQGVPYVDY